MNKIYAANIQERFELHRKGLCGFAEKRKQM